MSHKDDCTECSLGPARRDFMRQIGVAIAGALAVVGASRESAAQAVVTAIAGTSDDPDKVIYPIPASDGVQIDKKAEVILVRWENAVYAFNLSCPHQNTALRWNEGAHMFKCPKHSSRYKPDGTFIDGRATRAMDRFTVTRDGTNIVVDLKHMHKQDEHPGDWSASVVKLA